MGNINYKGKIEKRSCICMCKYIVNDSMEFHACCVSNIKRRIENKSKGESPVLNLVQRSLAVRESIITFSK